MGSGYDGGAGTLVRTVGCAFALGVLAGAALALTLIGLFVTR